MKNKYCLVGKSEDSSDYKVFPEIGQSLEQIDSFTLDYKNSEELDQHFSLKEKYNYFIFSYNQKYDRSYSVLYEDTSDFKEIPKAFINQETSLKRKEIEYYYREFCFKMKYSNLFRYSMLHKKNDLYPKFLDYFQDKNVSGDYLIHKDGGWVMKTYPLIRSVYYVLNKYPFLQDDYEVRDSVRRKLLEQFQLNRESEDLLEQRLELYQKMREDMMLKGSDTTYFDDMIHQLKGKDKDGYQYKK